MNYEYYGALLYIAGGVCYLVGSIFYLLSIK